MRQPDHPDMVPIGSNATVARQLQHCHSTRPCRNLHHPTVLNHTEGRAGDLQVDLMDKQDEYRRNAEYAQQMADGSAMQEDRASWLRVASGWRSLLRGPKAGDGHQQREQFDEHVQQLGTHQKASSASH
jgi:hypothetical protein